MRNHIMLAPMRRQKWLFIQYLATTQK